MISKIAIQAIKKAWKDVENEYSMQRICSERHLQAIFFQSLFNDIEFRDKYDIYVEPKFSKGNQFEGVNLENRSPDMVISTKNNSIEFIVELKYEPYKYVESKKDFETFKMFNELEKNKSAVLLKIEPDSGNWDKKQPFQISENISFVFASIAKEGGESHESEIWKGFKQYLHLIGAIGKIGTTPNFIVQIKGIF